MQFMRLFCDSTDGSRPMLHAATVTVTGRRLNTQYYDDGHVKCSCWLLPIVRQRAMVAAAVLVASIDSAYKYADSEGRHVYEFRAEVGAVVYYMQCAQCTYHEIIKTFSIPTTRCDAIRFHRVPAPSEPLQRHVLVHRPHTRSTYVCRKNTHFQLNCNLSAVFR